MKKFKLWPFVVYVGALVGSGVQLPYDRSVKSRKAAIDGLVRMGFDRVAIEKGFQGLKQVSVHCEEYVLDFIKAVAEDVMAFGERLFEKVVVTQKKFATTYKSHNGKYEGLVGNSPVIKQIFDMLDRLERMESPVLITGESGTGKELVAAAVHYNSARRDKAFVLQNCAAFSETLFNSELFGHEKGSFTGAMHDKKGLFELADGGTLFLDEIGDMSSDSQSRLLWVLEGGTFYSIGGTQQKKVNVRLVTATNKDLQKQIERGLFRKDLYYRINTIDIKMPPLRERKEDIPMLSDYFLELFGKLHSVGKKQLSRGVIDMFLAYPWPGNIRELKNLIERLVFLADKRETIEEHLIPEKIACAAFPPDCPAKGTTKDMEFQNALKSLEKNLVNNALSLSGWNKTHASSALGISRATLNNKIVEFSLRPEISP